MPLMKSTSEIHRIGTVILTAPYLSSGDGGGNPNFSQDKASVFGKVLRIDPIKPNENPTSSDPIGANGKYRIHPANFFQC